MSDHDDFGMNLPSVDCAAPQDATEAAPAALTPGSGRPLSAAPDDDALSRAAFARITARPDAENYIAILRRGAGFSDGALTDAQTLRLGRIIRFG